MIDEKQQNQRWFAGVGLLFTREHFATINFSKRIPASAEFWVETERTTKN